MELIVSNILLNEPFITSFKNYTLITPSNFNNIPKSSHIKYITLNEEIKIGGTFISSNYNNAWNKSYLIIKSSIPWKLKYQTNFIFYKPKPVPIISFRKLMRLIANPIININ